MLCCRFVVQGTPNSRDFLHMFLFLFSNLPGHFVTNKIIQLAQSLATAGGSSLPASPDLIIRELIVRRMDILCNVCSFLYLHLELWDCLVCLARQKRELNNNDCNWDQEIHEEEGLRLEPSISSVIDDPVEEKDGCRSVKSTSHERDNAAAELWESISNLERRQEDKSASQSKEEISNSVAIELVDAESKTHKNAARSKTESANQEAKPWAVSIKQSTNWECRYICHGRCKRKEEVQAQVLVETNFDIGIQFFLGAKIPKDAFFDENGLQSSESKDDAAGTPANKNRGNDLSCERV